MALLDELTIDTPVRVKGFGGKGKVVKITNVLNVEVCLGGSVNIIRPASDITVIYPENRPPSADSLTREEAMKIFGPLLNADQYVAVRFVVIDGERGAKTISVSATEMVDGVPVARVWTKAGDLAGTNPPVPARK